MISTVSRLSSICLLLGLAGLLVVNPAVASAASAGARLTGDTLGAQVTGGERTGAWRIRIVNPAHSERIDFVLRAGDVAWTAVVRTQARTPSGWATTDRRRINGTYTGLRTASGEGAGVRWRSTDFRLPRGGDGRFAISVELTADGSYKVVGSLRNAVEAFSYGPWQRVRASQVEH